MARARRTSKKPAPPAESPSAPPLEPVILLHTGRTKRRVVDPREVFYVEAIGEHTMLHAVGRRKFEDVRRLGELMPTLERFGFVRVHKNHAINPTRVLEVRRRPGGQDWELKLEPAKNLVLPVSRSALPELWRAYGEE